jgi:hypothetical protein
MDSEPVDAVRDAGPVDHFRLVGTQVTAKKGFCVTSQFWTLRFAPKGA